MEKSVDAEDGGNALIREMSPFEVDKTVQDLAKKWFEEKVGDWANNIEQEVCFKMSL